MNTSTARELPQFHDQLATIKSLLRLSMSSLAECSGVSRQAMSKYATGKGTPPWPAVQRMAETLHLDGNWLLFGEGLMLRQPEAPVPDSSMPVLARAKHLLLLQGGQGRVAEVAHEYSTSEEEMLEGMAEYSRLESLANYVDRVSATMARHGADQQTILDTILPLIRSAGD